MSRFILAWLLLVLLVMVGTTVAQHRADNADIRTMADDPGHGGGQQGYTFTVWQPAPGRPWQGMVYSASWARLSRAEAEQQLRKRLCELNGGGYC